MVSRRGAMKILAGLAVMPALAACGFQPMYGPTPSGERLQDVLAAVEIPEVPGRAGQQIRNELIFGMTGGGRPAEPRYRLRMVTKESVSDLMVESTGEARSATYDLNVNFSLERIDDGTVALEGSSVGRAAFDRFDPAFTNIRARRDAESRAARSVAENIKTRVAAFLATQA